jgi:hypothetical protein
MASAFSISQLGEQKRKNYVNNIVLAAKSAV